MRLGNLLRTVAMLTLAAISVVAVVAFVALRLGAVTPAQAREHAPLTVRAPAAAEIGPGAMAESGTGAALR